MDIKDIAHKWPPNIQAYEQKFMGVPMPKFIGGAMSGLVALIMASQLFPGIGGIIGGAVIGCLAFGSVVLLTTKFASFYHMTIPGYWIKRTFQPAEDKNIELPLIIAAQSDERVTMESWEGVATGEIE